jgi:prepilin-type processing-associated H-X9-DG protein
MFGWSDVTTGRTKLGVMIYDKAVAISEIPDGTSVTIIVAEDTGRGSTSSGAWSDGQNIFDQTGPVNISQNNEMWSEHPGGVNAAFCDGAVHFLSESLDPKVVEALCSRKGGEIVNAKAFP